MQLFDNMPFSYKFSLDFPGLGKLFSYKAQLNQWKPPNKKISSSRAATIIKIENIFSLENKRYRR
jgi:hypothetical protein